MKYALYALAACMALLALASAAPAHAQEMQNKVALHFFWAEGCPHCADEKPFLQQLEQRYDGLEVRSYEVTHSPENAELLRRAAQELNTKVSGVPFTVVGTHYFAGWYSEGTTGAAIEDAVRCAIETGCTDVVGRLVTPVTPAPGPSNHAGVPEIITLPLLGEIHTTDVSLPVLTVLIAALDGFNPCAMWVLVFLITLLFEMKDKRRMWALGTVFIAASGFVYFLFMAAWLNLFLFLGVILWVRIGVGILALAAGYHNLKEYVTNPAGVCKVTGEEKKQRIVERLKSVVHERHFALALLGLIALAFMVNMIELVCSAGLPAVYTQVLSLSDLPALAYYGYLMLYIIVFMLDDLIVFVVAMLTLQLTGATAKYTRASHLIGGVAMLAIGLLLIFRPELLMFG